MPHHTRPHQPHAGSAHGGEGHGPRGGYGDLGPRLEARHGSHRRRVALLVLRADKVLLLLTPLYISIHRNKSCHTHPMSEATANDRLDLVNAVKQANQKYSNKLYQQMPIYDVQKKPLKIFDWHLRE